ncbi:hypothetical protein Tco_0770654 [Tanacetum coccineum]|uniref:MAK10-like protein n=1 Tax=Tanacetum coccineum TaxID=301880 RepID=A0ABQ4ZCV5_9ASTR
MEAHLAPTQPTQVNKVTTSCEICSGPHDTQYCIEDPEQAFVEYASSRTDEARGKWYTFKPEQNNLGDTYNPSGRSHPNLRWRQPQNSQNNFSNPPNRFQPNGSIPNRFFNNRPQSFNNQSNLEGLVSNFMASQDARLSKFEADFKQHQNEMTNKIDTVLKAIIDRIAGALPSDTVKNPKLSTSLKQSDSYNEKAKENEEEEKDSSEQYPCNLPHADPPVAFITEKVLKFNSFCKSLGLVPQSSDTKVVCTKGGNEEVMFIELIRKNDDSSEREPEEEGSTTTEGIMKRKLDPRENSNRGVGNFTGRIKGMHVFLGNFTYIVDFMIVEDISSIIAPRLSQVVLWKPFVEISNMTHDPPEDLEKEHTKSVYLRNEEDKRRGVEYVISKMLGFYKECLELGTEYVTGMDDKGEVIYGRVTSSLATRLVIFDEKKLGSS